VLTFISRNIYRGLRPNPKTRNDLSSSVLTFASIRQRRWCLLFVLIRQGLTGESVVERNKWRCAKKKQEAGQMTTKTSGHEPQT